MAEELVVFEAGLAKEMLAAYRKLIDSGLLEPQPEKPKSTGGTRSTIVTNSPTPIYFRNDSTYTIPPYSLMQITDTVEVAGNQNYVTVERLNDSTPLRSPILINGSREVEVDGYGVAQSGPVFRVKTDGTAFTSGQLVGPETGEFTATSGSMFTVIGDDDVEEDVVRVMDDSTRLILAYTTGGATARVGTACGTGTATIRYLAASGATRTITTTSESVTYYNVSEVAVGVNRYIMLLRLGGDLIANWEDCI